VCRSAINGVAMAVRPLARGIKAGKRCSMVQRADKSETVMRR
jgi:hypothetical protein